MHPRAATMYKWNRKSANYHTAGRSCRKCRFQKIWLSFVKFITVYNVFQISHSIPNMNRDGQDMRACSAFLKNVFVHLGRPACRCYTKCTSFWTESPLKSVPVVACRWRNSARCYGYMSIYGATRGLLVATAVWVLRVFQSENGHGCSTRVKVVLRIH